MQQPHGRISKRELTNQRDCSDIYSIYAIKSPRETYMPSFCRSHSCGGARMNKLKERVSAREQEIGREGGRERE